MYIIIINFRNKIYSYLYYKYPYFSIQINHPFKNNFLYYKLYIINNINLYIKFNIDIKINVTIS